jgi:hypothetical protein
MSTVLKNRKRFPLIPVLAFVLLFGGVVWYGYTHFFRKEVVPVKSTNGINTSLPKTIEAKTLNKLEIYMQAEKDSASKVEQRTNDPYSKLPPDSLNKPVFKKPLRHGGVASYSLPGNKKIPPDEKAIDEKLAQLYKSIQTSVVDKPGGVGGGSIIRNDTLVEPRFEAGNMGSPKKDSDISGVPVDPELKQLDGMLDKLIAIQNPDNLKQRVSRKDSVEVKNRFVSSLVGSVNAVVHNTQILSSGSTIKLRLTTDMRINGRLVQKGNFLFGICSVNNERLTVAVTGVSFHNELIPVSLSVFDVDGMAGIYIPGAISREVSKEGADQAIQSLNLNSYEPSITGQLASAGLQATKALFSRKLRLVRVTVKAGHHILLKDANSF